MARRRRNTGSYIVSGPNVDRRAPSHLEGVSLAQTYAGRLEKPGTVYVRDLFGRTLTRVDLSEDHCIYTTRVAS